jgi:hypothetical protein
LLLSFQAASFLQLPHSNELVLSRGWHLTMGQCVHRGTHHGTLLREVYYSSDSNMFS